ncbi:DUF6090 family protein [Portibacter marinus]|uniref:DUF6090 family protein n=1 Tax=Portibacter marinus TaxID=2898660 RepID=UPI001F2D6F0F|nr:DUF6090 family protein [Portibacter marinus]
MLKILKNIRRKAIGSSSFRKYTIYALGEIILVVIGILIALQVNTWNNASEEKKKENTYLRNIERDLQDQINTIDRQIKYEESISDQATPIIEKYKRDGSFLVDSVFTDAIGYISGRKTFIKNDPTYTELLSSGNIDIISDNMLKDEIIKYYQELTRLELIFNKNNNLFVDQIFLPEAISLTELQIGSEFTLNKSNNPEPDMMVIDLNEERLKNISTELLKVPQNELKMINIINFRNFISAIHLGFLPQLRDKTIALLDLLKQ